MSRQNVLKMPRILIHGVILAGAVLVSTGAGAAHATTSVDVAAAVAPAHLDGEDDLGWQ